MHLEITPLQTSDIPAVIDLLATSMPTEAISEQKFARHILLDPNYRDDGALLAKVGNCVAGFIYVAVRDQPLNDIDARRGYITVIAVDPKFRRQKIATALLAAAEGFIQKLGRSDVLISPYAPAYFTPGVDVASYPAAVTMFSKCGYAEVNRPIAMQTDLWNITEPEFAIGARQTLARDGVHIEAYSPPLTQPILQFARTEFGPDWDVVYREAMQQILRGQASPARIAVAHQHGRVLGISHHDGERFGPIGVGANARHRGIGQVLMYETLQAQRFAGHRVAWFLWGDDRTAERLYRGAGFVEIRRFVILGKTL